MKMLCRVHQLSMSNMELWCKFNSLLLSLTMHLKISINLKMLKHKCACQLMEYLERDKSCDVQIAHFR